ncbi:hypothetical protein [Cellulomonas timonensis]|uniref:hypothetical protein n=1 Tax=Cellulomonas timonensis TaxID=1689271 RepID=UPI0008328BC3|nr:hypothetical protein [Cellulomonas timonensis]
MPELDVEELWIAWVNSANEMDEFVLVSDLLESAAARGHGDGIELGRARAAILAGRPALAAGLLADVDRSVLTNSELTWRDVTAMAAWAALGDVEALEALVRAGQHTDGPRKASHLYLLAAAAEQAGQLDLADAVWRELSETTNLTSAVLTPNIVADILQRSTTDPGLAAGTLGKAAREVIELIPMPEDSLRPTLDVVARLEARGDRAGAWLLLEAMSALRPVAKGLGPLRKERSSGGGWWWERLPGLMAVVAAAVITVAGTLRGLPNGFALGSVLFAVAVWKLWRLPQGRGLSGVDPVVLAAVRRLLPDVVSEIPARIRTVAAHITGGGIGLLWAILVVSLCTELLLTDLYDANRETSDAIIFPFIALCTVIGGIVGPRQLRRLQIASARQLVNTRRAAQVIPAGQCVCVSSSRMRDIKAERYLADHLRAPQPDVAAAVPVIPSATLTAHQCPLSKTPWLEVRRPDREVLLLRGALAYVSDESEDTVGGYL